MLNLDTHILIHALSGGLTSRENRKLSQEPWSISAIVLWELAKLFQLGRIDLDIHGAELSQALSRLHVWPLDLAVCRKIGELDFRSDPVDEIIAATSLEHRVRLVTRDRKILASRVVPLA